MILAGIILKIISSTFYLFSGIIWKRVIRKTSIIGNFLSFHFGIASTLLAILAFQNLIALIILSKILKMELF